MKLLVVLLAVLFGVWLWRRGRRIKAHGNHGVRQLKAESMVPCARCGVHVPRSTATMGRLGLYCCEAHRREAENG